MGRGRRGGKRDRGPRGPRVDPEGPAPEAGRTDLMEKGDMNNERFVRYYRKQSILPDDGEFDEMLDAFRRHLPTTFRVAGSRQTVHTLNKTITDVHVPSLSDVTFEGEKIPPPVQIPWYPEGYAWQFNVPKKVLRKQPEFKKFHSFLVFETEVGNISRQEAVSMVPPLFLDVQPHHKVMDMCAAPGSKTAQLLEALHAADTATSTSIPSGLLIANDSDHKRTHLLIHQSARLPSPALMVTNLDASSYPIIKVPNPQTGKMGSLTFDRILCDVPCSGDGTMRKNMGIWKSWQPMDGNGLHSLQLRILQRAMRMLEKSGRIVYSTCSLNPVENEAVIAAALNSYPDFELVDVSSTLPALKRMPGLNKWIMSVDRTATQFFETYEELMASSLDQNTKNRFLKTQWAPENVSDLNIERCMRIYPHLQDTGGFFVAVLERKKKEPATSRKRTNAEVEAEEVPEAKRTKVDDASNPPAAPAPEAITAVPSTESAMDTTEDSPPAATASSTPKEAASPKDPNDNAKDSGKGKDFKEDPYTYLPANHPLLEKCIARLNIIPSFPSHNVLVRNSLADDSIRSFYISNDLVKAVITNNDYQKLRLTAAGTKVFTKQEAGKGLEAQYRVLGEGLPVVLPFVKPEAILRGSLSVLKTFLESYYPLVRTFEEEFRSQIDESSTGSLIVRFPPEEKDGVALTHDLYLPIWKSNVSLSLMIDKKAKSALSLRLFHEDLMLKATNKKQGDASTESAQPEAPPVVTEPAE